MPSGVTHILFVRLGIILILVLGFYSGLSGRVRTVYCFSLCVVSLLSSRFTASAFVWFSNFLLVFPFFITLSAVFICRSSRVLWLLMYQGAFRMYRSLLDYSTQGGENMQVDQFYSLVSLFWNTEEGLQCYLAVYPYISLPGNGSVYTFPAATNTHGTIEWDMNPGPPDYEERAAAVYFFYC
jgi:hypothetical protein